MQLSLAFPAAPGLINNRAMAGKDRTDAEKLEAAKKLRNKALRLLTTREHSREELLRKLAQAKARRARQDAQVPAPEKDEVERVIDELAAQGWQSDERYAEAIVRRLTGQASRRYIEEKLATAGIRKDAARDALASLEQDELEVATALWERRYGEPPADDKIRQKQIRFLLTRGFHLGDAFKIVPRALASSSARQSGTADNGTSSRRSSGMWPSRRTDVASIAGTGKSTESALAVDTPSRITADAVLEYTRTSSLRASRRPADGTVPVEPDGDGRLNAGRSQLRRTSFRSAVKRARPWGARNDADPSDE